MVSVTEKKDSALCFVLIERCLFLAEAMCVMDGHETRS